jgi:uncharacterized protein YjbJ (UPF0337 family)
MPSRPKLPASLTPMLRADLFATMLDARRMPRGVSYRQADFLSVLTVRPSLTRADYQALAHVSANTAQLDIAELLAAGLIVRRGAGPSSRYCIVDVFEQIPLQEPRYRQRVARQSPADRHEVTPASPVDPHAFATESPQSKLQSLLAFLLRTTSLPTQGGVAMAETDSAKDKVQGKLHEVKGAATGDTGEEMKGKLQGAKGDVEHEMNKAQREDVRDDARREADRRVP